MFFCFFCWNLETRMCCGILFVRDTWVKKLVDCANTSNPLTYQELFSTLKTHGSMLPEDHYFASPV